jgi:O-antigen/teichoic acid export membrane protein
VALLIVGLQSALTPLIYAHYREPETPAHLARIVEGFVFVAFGCCLVLGLFAWEILTVFAEPRYLPAAALIMALAPATLLGQMYIFFPGIAIARKTHHQLVIFVITAIGSLGANWLLIGAFGLAGAVVATLLSAMLFIGLWIWASQRLYPLPVRWMRMALICLLFAGAGASGLAIYEAGLPPLVSSLSRLALLAVFTVAGLAAGLIPLGRLRDLANRARHRMRSARSAN